MLSDEKGKMTHKELIKLLTDKEILFVVVGGVAMRIHNSPRVTYDIDIAVRTLDVDTTIGLLYDRSCYLIREIEGQSARISRDPVSAQEWIETNKSGADLDDIRFLKSILRGDR